MLERTEYRLVGIRADKNRMVICEHLTKQQAERTKENLSSEHVFLSVEMEVEDSAPLGLHLIADN